MVFNSLSLYNFKNFESAKASFVDGINCIVGSNGVGKTNILDALHYISLGKSAINPIDTTNIRYDQEAFFIKTGITRKKSTLEVVCAVQTGKKKSLKVNNEEYGRLSEHVGYLPVVMISPNDNSLIIDGNEARRKFFDSTISQINKQYLYNLVRYQKALRQRNALLKEFSQKMSIDEARLEPFNHELISLAGELFDVRNKFLKKFERRFNKLYKKLSHEHEEVSISYESQWQKEDPEALFRSAINPSLLA